MPKTIEGKTYFTASEAAQQAGVSRWTIKRWLADKDKRNGHIKIFKDKMNGRIYVDQESLRSLVNRLEAVQD